MRILACVLRVILHTARHSPAVMSSLRQSAFSQTFYSSLDCIMDLRVQVLYCGFSEILPPRTPWSSLKNHFHATASANWRELQENVKMKSVIKVMCVCLMDASSHLPCTRFQLLPSYYCSQAEQQDARACTLQALHEPTVYLQTHLETFMCIQKDIRIFNVLYENSFLTSGPKI